MVRVAIITLKSRVDANDNLHSDPAPRPVLFLIPGRVNRANNREARSFNASAARTIRWARKGSGRIAAEERKLNYSIKIQPGLNDLQLNLEPKWLTSQLSTNN